MRTIWKYALTESVCEFKSPALSSALHVGDQNGTLCVWALVDTDDEFVSRRLHVVGTGHPLPDVFNEETNLRVIASHLGSAIVGEYVWHVFEESPE